MGRIVVINPEDIEVLDESVIDNYDQSDREAYLTLLMAMQSLIDEYERTGEIHLNAPTSFTALTPEWKKDYLLKVNFRELFLSPANWIITERNSEGRYVVMNDGHLRMYIAKRYGLRIPVYVED